MRGRGSEGAGEEGSEGARERGSENERERERERPCGIERDRVIEIESGSGSRRARARATAGSSNRFSPFFDLLSLPSTTAACLLSHQPNHARPHIYLLPHLSRA
eukprot:1534368-Pleurochrysis_carterae.AAC.1